MSQSILSPPKYFHFVYNDVVLGAKTVVEAVRYAKIVAESMDEYIRSLPETDN